MDLGSRVEELREIAKEMDPHLHDMCIQACNKMADEINNEALEDLNKLILDINMDKDPHWGLADLLFTLELYEPAAELYESLAKTTELAIIWNNLGVSLSRLGNDKKAVKIYRRGLKLDPSSARLWFNLGKAYHRLGVHQEALKAFVNATRLDPMNKSAWNNLGVTYRTLGKADKAFQCYEQAAGIDPAYAWAWHNMGVLMLSKGQTQDAKKYFQKALEVKPGYAPSKKILEKIGR